MKQKSKWLQRIAPFIMSIAMVMTSADFTVLAAQKVETWTEYESTTDYATEAVTESEEVDVIIETQSVEETETMPETTQESEEVETTLEDSVETEPETSWENVTEETVTEVLTSELEEGTENGFTYIYNDTGATITAYTGSDTEVVIPKTIGGYKVIALQNNLFYRNQTIQSVTILAEIETIPDGTFSYCRKLEMINLPDTLKKIDRNSFVACELLSEIVLPVQLEMIGTYAFQHCQSLKKIIIPNSVVSLGEGVFANCESLYEVQLSNSLTSLAPNMFSDCYMLSGIYIPASINTIENNVFTNCSMLTIYGENNSYAHVYALKENIPFIEGSMENIQLEEIKVENITYIHNGSTAIVKDCMVDLSEYSQNEYLITIPEEVEGYEVVGLKAGLLSQSVSCYENILVIIDIKAKITEIPDECFWNYNQYYTVKLPDSIKRIGAYAFGYSGIQNVIVPDSVEIIGEKAFGGCKELKEVQLSNSLTEVDDGMFHGCASLEEVVIPDSVKYIGGRGGVGVFENCSSLKSVKLPISLQVIYDKEFKGCSSLKCVELTPNLERIDELAFEGCSKLSAVYIPSEITSGIENGIFAECPFLTIYGEKNSYAQTYAEQNQISFKEGDMVVEDIGLVEGVIFDYIHNGNDAILTSYKGDDTELIIPEKIDNYSIIGFGTGLFKDERLLESIKINAQIERISSNCFQHCEKLSTVQMPDSVIEIGGYAFYQCIGINEIVLPPKVETIGRSAFYGCNSLENLELPVGLKKIEDYAFAYTAIESIEIPETIEIWKGMAFAYSKLKKISVPNSIEVGTGNFYDCKELSEVKIYKTSQTMQGTFSGCSSLTTVDIPKGVEKMYWTFRDCYSLSEIYLPETVVSIYNRTFGNCTKLTSVYIPESVKTIDVDVFTGCPYVTLSVVAGSFGETFAKENNIPYVLVTETEELAEGEIPAGRMQTYADANMPYTIYLSDIEMKLDEEAVKTLAESAGDSSILAKCEEKTSADTGKSAIDTEIKKILKNKDNVYNLNLIGKDSGQALTFSKASVGTMTITLPAKKLGDTDPIVYHIAEDGTKTDMSATYNQYMNTVSFNTTHLSYYSVEGQDPNDDGTGDVPGTGEEPGETDGVLPEDIPEGGIPEGLWASQIADVTYTGKALKPVVRVYDTNTRLKEGKDYTLKYVSNVKVGEASIQITGKGNYKGTVIKHFNIVAKNLADVDITAADVFAVKDAKDKVKTPTVSVKHGTKALKLTAKNKKNDYSVTGFEQALNKDGTANVGTYTLTIIGNGNYTGSKTVKYTVYEKKTSVLNLKKAKVSIAEDSPVKTVDYFNTDSCNQIRFKVKIGTSEISADDYLITWPDAWKVGSNNVVLTANPQSDAETGAVLPLTGSVTVKVTATGGGSIKGENFVISGIEEKGYDYTGFEIKPIIGVAYKNASGSENTEITELTEGVDYKVIYQNNVKTGKNAKAVVTGIGGYSGKVSLKYTINKVEITESIIVIDDTAVYNKNGAKPVITARLDAYVLKEGTDYTVKCTNNKTVSSAETKAHITITGKGNFSGTVEKDFSVINAGVEDICIHVNEMFNPKNVKKVKVNVLETATGKKLTLGQEYKEIEYLVKNENGVLVPLTDEVLKNAQQLDVTVRVTLAGIYGTESKDFPLHIYSQKASDFVLGLPKKNYDYTGQKIEPEVSVKVKDKKVNGKWEYKELTKGVEYSVSAEDYKNNIKSGKATITVHGEGIYGGSKKITFTIGKQTMNWNKWFAEIASWMEGIF